MTRHSHPVGSRAGACAGWLLACVVGACGTNSLDGSYHSRVSGSGGAGFDSIDAGAADAGTTIVNCDDPSGTGATGMTGLPIFPSVSEPILDGVAKAFDPPPPISGGTLLVLRGGTRAVAADPDRDRIYVVDLISDLSLTLRGSIDLALHDQPGRLAEDGAGRVHILLRGSGKLVTIDPVTAAVLLTRTLCAAPRGIAYDPALDRLHVACADGQLLTLAPQAMTPERTIGLPQDLRDVVVDGPRLLVTRFRSAEMLVVDATGAMTETIRPVPYGNIEVHGGSRYSPAVAWRAVGMPDGGAVMVHQRGMDGTIAPARGGYGGPGSCDTIVHTAVTRMKPGKRPVAGPAMPGFVLPVDLSVSPNGTRLAMVAAGNGHAMFNGARRLWIANVDDATLEWPEGCGHDDKHRPEPAPACSYNGNPVPPTTVCPPGFVVCGQAVCASEMQGCPVTDGGVTVIEAGVAPNSGGADGGVAASPPANDGGRAPADAGSNGGAGSGDAAGMGDYVYHCNAEVNTGSGLPAEPIAVAFVDNDRVLVQVREPAQLVILSDSTSVSTTLTLSQESRADTGHTVFHSNSGGDLACASCHPEGHEDGRVWNFQCGQSRRTQDPSGGLKGTEPFHWSGDLPSFQSLMDNVFVGRMSGPRLSREQTDAVLDWLNTIPEKTPLRSAAELQVLRGKALFNRPDVACFSCHSGPALTNNATVNVGTSASFQVPSLRGVGWRGPYLHDGCAATLEDRFTDTTCAGGDEHGHTSQLAPSDIADLVAYLQSL